MASSVETVQAPENVVAESKTSTVVLPAVVPTEDGDIKKADTSAPIVAIPASDQSVPGPIAATSQTAPATEKMTLDSTTQVVESVGTKNVETKETGPSAQDASSTAATTVVPVGKTEEVKVESVTVSKVVSGVVEDINNVEVGLAKEAPPASGSDVSKPNLLTTLEGGLKIVEKEAEKGAVETVATVEQHPELIAEGALAAVVGAASMVQPELLPGAVALVGKMASDAAKKTVINIATTEGKKVGAAIGKDISNDASTVPAQTETPRPTNQEATSSELALSAPKNVVEVAKAASPPEKAKAAPVSTPEQPAIFRQETKPLVLAAAASITSTTTTTKTTNGESATQLEKTMVTISQESLDLLHQKLDVMHEAIKQITNTLALHLPPPTPTIEPSKQHTATESASEPEPTLELSEIPTAPTPEPSKADTTETRVEPVTSASEQSPPKRPTLEKRSSVLGSIGKILWPFGSASPTKTVVDGVEVTTVDSNAPKVPTVVVTEVPLTPEIEIST